MIQEPTLFDLYPLVKVAVCGIGALILALCSTGCTSNFGAIGGPEIQRIYNERVAIKKEREVQTWKK